LKETYVKHYFLLIHFSLIVKQPIFDYVNNGIIRSWNQPVLTNEGKVNNGSLWWSSTTDMHLRIYESDTLPTASYRPSNL